VSVLGRYRPRAEALGPSERCFGLDGLDFRLASFLHGRGGTYIEAGANDGIAQSNTAFFERFREWSGLLVEPVPELADRCRANRPGSIVEQAALVASDYPQPTIEMRFANLMSVVEGARGSADADREHVELGVELQALADTYTVDVPAQTLSSLLDRHGLDDVDLLVLDLEGYEAQALRGLDLERHQPRHILVEVWDTEAIEAALGDQYEQVARLSHHDVLYRSGRR
jgi:FkbM family methyltransferase